MIQADTVCHQEVRPTEVESVPVAAKKRCHRIVVDIMFFASILFAMFVGFAWWQSGEFDRVGPWIQGQRLFVSADILDFGTVKSSDAFEGQIRLSNRSSKPITILGSQASCGCVTLDELPVTIPRNSDHELRVRIDTPASTGSFEHSLKLLSDDQGNTVIPVIVRGVVE